MLGGCLAVRRHQRGVGRGATTIEMGVLGVGGPASSNGCRLAVRRHQRPVCVAGVRTLRRSAGVFVHLVRAHDVIIALVQGSPSWHIPHLVVIHRSVFRPGEGGVVDWRDNATVQPDLPTLHLPQALEPQRRDRAARLGPVDVFRAGCDRELGWRVRRRQCTFILMAAGNRFGNHRVVAFLYGNGCTTVSVAVKVGSGGRTQRSDSYVEVAIVVVVTSGVGCIHGREDCAPAQLDLLWQREIVDDAVRTQAELGTGRGTNVADSDHAAAQAERVLDVFGHVHEAARRGLRIPNTRDERRVLAGPPSIHCLLFHDTSFTHGLGISAPPPPQNPEQQYNEQRCHDHG